MHGKRDNLVFRGEDLAFPFGAAVKLLPEVLDKLGSSLFGNAQSPPPSKACPNQGPVPPPALTGFFGTMSPSDFHDGPRLTISDHPVGGRDPPPSWISHVASKTLCAC